MLTVTPPRRRRGGADRRPALGVHAATRSPSGSTGPPTASSRSTSGASGCGRSPSRSWRRRTGRDDAVVGGRAAAQGARRGVADAAADPPRRPAPAADAAGPAQRAWTAADQLLVDEANSILNGPPLTYGHVVVDEAQDHSAVALRVIGRRSPAASMTLVGDVAQSTTPGRPGALGRRVRPPAPARRRPGRSAELTIGYRVPEPILVGGQPAAAAHRCRRHAPAAACGSRVTPPRLDVHVARPSSPPTVAAVVAAVKHRHRLTGVVAPLGHHDALSPTRSPPPGWHAVDHLHELHPRRGPAVRPRAGQGPRVRRGGGRRARRDPRRDAARRPPALRGDDPRRPGAGVRHDVPDPPPVLA